MLLAIYYSTHVPKRFWRETVLRATHLINRMPSRTLGNKSPIQKLSDFYPKIHVTSNLPPKVFRCAVFIHIHKQFKSKLDPKAMKCIFIGYSNSKKGYKCFLDVCPRS